MIDSLEELLQKLGSNDDRAAERIFIAYEPYLRKVVRRLLPENLRPKFDSIDVVQSVWGDLLDGFRGGRVRFGSAAQLRAFLIKATRNRFVDRVRHFRTAVKLEQPIPETGMDQLTSAAPPASAVMEADELWERLLALSPAEHHRILELRRQGFTFPEIASRTGLHEGSVRRIIRTLSVKLATASETRSEGKG